MELEQAMQHLAAHNFMQFLIPKQIRKDKDILQNVKINFFKKDSKNTLSLDNSKLKQILDSNVYINLHDAVFSGVDRVVFELFYNDIFKKIEYNDPTDLVYGSVPEEDGTTLIRKNKSWKNKDFVLENLNYQYSETLDKTVKGTKNLVYLCVYGNEYLDMAIGVLDSFKENDFDVLLITDHITKQNLIDRNLNFSFNLFYHLTSTPIDGISASMNKLKIFDYSNINEYNKILYIDCDMLLVGNLNDLFSHATLENKLYVFNNKRVEKNSFLSIFHGVQYKSELVLEAANSKNYFPFNAGQFLFLNSDRMKSHFYNVIKFSKEWSGRYFFEQSFMNVYFVLAGVLNYSLANKVAFYNSQNTLYEKVHDQNTVLIHFIAPALNANKKMSAMNEYKNLYC